ncbi:MAG: hypothetical protein HC903_27770, partial [Methylacidiphilales bacterium]|nr:hypothetical protein [Candidatus Methylacidiphilales bacterium]
SKECSLAKIIHGDTNTGGMLRHLINVHREQVAVMDAEISRISSEKKKLEVKIHDLELLAEEASKFLQVQK